MADGSARTTDPTEPGGLDAEPRAQAVPRIAVPKVGVLAWSFIGVVVATLIVVTAFSAVSEIILPLLFAVVLAVVFKPVAGKLERHRFRPSWPQG